MPLTVVDHPLVADRISRLRDRETPSGLFRQWTSELAHLLAYEATRFLPTTPTTVTTPLGMPAEGSRLSEPGPVVVPILRAGLGLLEGVLTAVHTAEVGVVGLRRDEKTFQPDLYGERLPSSIDGRDVFIIDPMLATGGSMVAACDLVLQRGARHITAICLISSPAGTDRLFRDYPSVHVFSAAHDPELNEHAFIVPGLGDAGDRLYGL